MTAIASVQSGQNGNSHLAVEAPSPRVLTLRRGEYPTNWEIAKTIQNPDPNNVLVLSWNRIIYVEGLPKKTDANRGMLKSSQRRKYGIVPRKITKEQELEALARFGLAEAKPKPEHHQRSAGCPFNEDMYKVDRFDPDNILPLSRTDAIYVEGLGQKSPGAVQVTVSLYRKKHGISARNIGAEDKAACITKWSNFDNVTPNADVAAVAPSTEVAEAPKDYTMPLFHQREEMAPIVTSSHAQREHNGSRIVSFGHSTEMLKAAETCLAQKDFHGFVLNFINAGKSNYEILARVMEDPGMHDHLALAAGLYVTHDPGLRQLVDARLIQALLVEIANKRLLRASARS